MKMTSLLGAILTAIFSLTLFCVSASDMARVRIEVRADSKDIVLTLQNESNRSILISDFSVADGANTGYWVYLFDAKKKFVIKPNAIYQLPPGGVESNSHVQRVAPGGKVEFRENLSEVLKFFGAENKCNYLIVVYRRKFGDEFLVSKPSSPIWVCESD